MSGFAQLSGLRRSWDADQSVSRSDRRFRAAAIDPDHSAAVGALIAAGCRESRVQWTVCNREQRCGRAPGTIAVWPSHLTVSPPKRSVSKRCSKRCAPPSGGGSSSREWPSGSGRKGRTARPVHRPRRPEESRISTAPGFADYECRRSLRSCGSSSRSRRSGSRSSRLSAGTSSLGRRTSASSVGRSWRCSRSPCRRCPRIVSLTRMSSMRRLQQSVAARSADMPDSSTWRHLIG